MAVVPKPQDNAANESAFFVLVTGLVYKNNTTTKEESMAGEEVTAKRQKKRVICVSGVYLESAMYLATALEKNKIWGRRR